MTFTVRVETVAGELADKLFQSHPEAKAYVDNLEFGIHNFIKIFDHVGQIVFDFVKNSEQTPVETPVAPETTPATQTEVVVPAAPVVTETAPEVVPAAPEPVAAPVVDIIQAEEIPTSNV